MEIKSKVRSSFRTNHQIAESLRQQLSRTSRSGPVKSKIKKIIESEADGNFIGMAKFDKNIIPKLFNGISNCLEIDKNSYYTSAIELLINNGQSVYHIPTNNLQWMDIDEPNEFDEAKILFNQLENEK